MPLFHLTEQLSTIKVLMSPRETSLQDAPLRCRDIGDPLLKLQVHKIEKVER